eukprot:UN10792
MDRHHQCCKSGVTKKRGGQLGCHVIFQNVEINALKR